MEGSRQSRAASRYGGATPAAAAFNGPVRKWKKQWVTTSHSKNRKEAPPLLLCRWTPLSAAADEPPKRRFRYAPIVPIEKGSKKGAKKVRNEGAAASSVRNGANNGGDITSESEGVLEKPDNGDMFMEEEAPELSEDPTKSLVHGSYYEQKKGD